GGYQVVERVASAEASTDSFDGLTLSTGLVIPVAADKQRDLRSKEVGEIDAERNSIVVASTFHTALLITDASFPHQLRKNFTPNTNIHVVIVVFARAAQSAPLHVRVAITVSSAQVEPRRQRIIQSDRNRERLGIVKENVVIEIRLRAAHTTGDRGPLTDFILTSETRVVNLALDQAVYSDRAQVRFRLDQLLITRVEPQIEARHIVERIEEDVRNVCIEIRIIFVEIKIFAIVEVEISVRASADVQFHPGSEDEDQIRFLV